MLEKESFYQMNGGERKMRMEERISRMLITLGITSRLKGLRLFDNRIADGH